MIKTFTSDIVRNLIKIFCLTLGLAIGFLLIARVYFEQTYDTHFSNYKRIYKLSQIILNGDEDKEYPKTPGAIAPGMKRYIPQVEEATRYTVFLESGTLIKTEDGNLFKTGGVILADSCFFKIFHTRCIAGNLEESLGLKNTCVIPQSLAAKMGGDVIGREITSPNFSEDYKIRIGGVYKDFPLNSSIGPNKIYLSLPSIGAMSFDNSNGWVGGDRYCTYVRLSKGTFPKDISAGIEKMLRENAGNKMVDVYHYNFLLNPLAGLHAAGKSVKMTIRILTLLAIIMLMSAGLNYLLVTLGQMESRSKEMAIRKCLGTGNMKIFLRVMAESLVMLLISLGLSILLAFCFSDECRKLLGHTPAQFYTTGNVLLVEAIVILVLLCLTGAIPAWMYCKTPVLQAFRPSVSGRKIWKLLLLSLQFFASAMLLSLLVLVMRQYKMLSSTDLGFEYENIGIANLANIPGEARASLVEKIERIPGVAGVASSTEDFASTPSGNNIWIDDNTPQYNITDMDEVSPNIFEILGIDIIKGETFRADSTVNQVIVEQKIVDILRDKFHLDVNDDNILGQRFFSTGHLGINRTNEFEICGVVKNMHRNGFEMEYVDTRGALFFPPSQKVMDILYVRFDKISPEVLSKVQNVIDETFPTAEIYISPYKETIMSFIRPIHRFSISILIVGAVIFIIALIGLTGFVTDEVQRRAKEIAIRKATGTSSGAIVSMLCRETSRVAIPSLIAGGAMAMIIGRKWLSQFTSQVSLSPFSMIICLVILMGFILLIVWLNSMKIASANPVRYLRDE